MGSRNRRWQVGGWILDEGRHSLEYDSVVVPVRAKLLAVMICLIESYPDTVDTETIVKSVWGKNSFMDRASVSHAIWSIRRLMSEAASPPVIETIPRRGYRLISTPRLLTPTFAGLYPQYGFTPLASQQVSVSWESLLEE